MRRDVIQGGPEKKQSLYLKPDGTHQLGNAVHLGDGKL
jgi:hypothetical protein